MVGRKRGKTAWKLQRSSHLLRMFFFWHLGQAPRLQQGRIGGSIAPLSTSSGSFPLSTVPRLALQRFTTAAVLDGGVAGERGQGMGALDLLNYSLSRMGNAESTGSVAGGRVSA